MASYYDQTDHQLQDHMFPAFPHSQGMRDIWNLLQSAGHVDVPILNDPNYFDFGVIPIDIIQREPRPEYSMMDNREDAFPESSFIMNGLELEDMHHELGPNTSRNSGSSLSEETFLEHLQVLREPRPRYSMMDYQDDAFPESSFILELENMHHALGLNTSRDSGSGLSEETILEHLQVITPKAKFGGENEGQKEEIDTCAICHDEYDKNKNLGRMQCGHLFHVDCIKSWLSRKNSCPMCRATA